MRDKRQDHKMNNCVVEVVPQNQNPGIFFRSLEMIALSQSLNPKLYSGVWVLNPAFLNSKRTVTPAKLTQGSESSATPPWASAFGVNIKSSQTNHADPPPFIFRRTGRNKKLFSVVIAHTWTLMSSEKSLCLICVQMIQTLFKNFKSPWLGNHVKN